MSTDNPKVKHIPLAPFDYGTLVDDAATFYINNKVYHGFKSIKISRNLMSLTGSFEITLTDKWKENQEPFDIKVGYRIHCHLGKDALFEGYIDKMTLSISADTRNITIIGRDKTSDLVDCVHVGASEFLDIDMQSLSDILCKPFSIKVINEFGSTKKFPKFTVKQGETVFESLERAAKELNIILVSTTHGNLLLQKKGVKTSTTQLIEGVNCLVASGEFDNTERFSHYIVKGQNTSSLGDVDDSTSSSGEAFDLGVTRYRPIVIISENAVDNAGAQKRAEYESSLRAAKSSMVAVSVQGWRQQDKTIWVNNLLVNVDIPSVGIRGKMLISKVKYDETGNGKRCELELIRPDAFEFKKETKKNDDPIDTLGWEK